MDTQKDRFARNREQMVRLDLQGRNITDDAVLKAMAKIPREEFITEKYKAQAYSDGPLPVGMGQTISQPYIVALMTEALKINSKQEVLEIGTGSGYQTAVLASIVKRVYTVERFNQLSESAQAVLGRLGFDNIEFFIGDGSKGWYKQRTFDRVLVTAAVPQIPQPLISQLITGGILVAPVGYGSVQKLIVSEKKPVGCTEKSICDVRFVKLIGEHGFDE